jgi:Ni/Co efflux regulator RcnB
MKRLICATIVALLLGGTVLASRTPGQGKARKHARQAHSTEHKRSDAAVSVHVVFAKGDVTILRNHYAPRYRKLPPGLQKKVARGGQLPPGWRKKFEPFPLAVERQLPRLPQGYRRGVIDGHAVIYNSRTNVVVDIAVLF